MGSRGPWQQVGRDEWRGRRKNARDFLQAARDLRDLADDDGNGNPIMSEALLAVIGYADALTVRFAGIQNTGDHATIANTLRRALGERLPRTQLTRLRRMISQKNDIQYDHRTATIAEASEFVEQAERFARWAERELARP